MTGSLVAYLTLSASPTRLLWVTTGIRLVVDETDHGCWAELGNADWGSFVNWCLSFPSDLFPFASETFAYGHTRSTDLVKKKLLWCQASYWNLVFMDSCCFIVKSEFYLAFKTLCNLTPALLFILISCLFSSPEVSAMLNHLFPLTMLSLISESSPIPSLFEIWSFHHYLFVVAFSVPPRSTFWVK